MVENHDHIVTELANEHRELLRRLSEANADLVERVHQLGLSLSYDHESDEFLCIIGEPVEAATISIDNILFFRYDPETLKIVGFGILGLRAHRGKSELLERIAPYDPIAVARTMAGEAARALAGV